jgi:hypothetical protein
LARPALSQLGDIFGQPIEVFQAFNFRAAAGIG